MYRLGIDIGGTFTDLVLVDHDGEIRLHKVSSTPEEPADAIAEGVDELASELDLATGTLLERCDLVIHGTTVAINALIQQSGARTALLCTNGFRDSHEIRLGFKERRYDFLYPSPPVLVPRRLRLPVRERVTNQGHVYAPLDEEQVRRHAELLRREGIEAVAVSFLWSFLNDAHERRVGEILAEELPGVFCSLSVDVLPQIREYERTSTTILNAYVGPILERYVQRTEQMFRARGLKGQIRYMQANAGFASGASLMRRPVYALNSGPAAGPTAALAVGRHLGYDNIVSVDMGGTSFDVCLVKDGLPDTVKNVDVCRYRVGIPMININTIGAGGGSIAWLDTGGILRVGPRSAEAEPGPACYGRGGVEPTVTDASVLLGFLNPRELLGGRLELDQPAAERAVRSAVAEPLGLAVEEAAHGIFEVVNHNMATGISEVLVERGYDPRDFALVVGGGAGALHAGRLAAELGIPTVMIPKVASAFCAFGEVVADLRHDYHASYTTRLADVDLVRLNDLFTGMEQEGRDELAEEGVAPDDIVVTRTVEMRYLGQVHECPVSIPASAVDEPMVSEIADLFHQRHELLYTYAERETGVPELINLSVTVLGKVPPIRTPELPAAGKDPAAAQIGERPAYFVEHGRYLDTPVFDGSLVQPGNEFAGPAIVEEPTTTIVVFPDSRMTFDGRGFYAMWTVRRNGVDADVTAGARAAEG